MVEEVDCRHYNHTLYDEVKINLITIFTRITLRGFKFKQQPCSISQIAVLLSGCTPGFGSFQQSSATSRCFFLLVQLEISTPSARIRRRRRSGKAKHTKRTHVRLCFIQCDLHTEGTQWLITCQYRYLATWPGCCCRSFCFCAVSVLGNASYFSKTKRHELKLCPRNIRQEQMMVIFYENKKYLLYLRQWYDCLNF